MTCSVVEEVEIGPLRFPPSIPGCDSSAHCNFVGSKPSLYRLACSRLAMIICQFLSVLCMRHLNSCLTFLDWPSAYLHKEEAWPNIKGTLYLSLHLFQEVCHPAWPCQHKESNDCPCIRDTAIQTLFPQVKSRASVNVGHGDPIYIQVSDPHSTHLQFPKHLSPSTPSCQRCWQRGQYVALVHYKTKETY